jgi:AraC-like DNA-binding protein
MVCNRCKLVVKSELETFGLHPLAVELGEAEVPESLSDADKIRLNARFNELGFELIGDRKSRIIEQVKNTVVQLIHHSEEPPKANLSDQLAQQIGLDYSYISNLFTQVEGITIEQYAITQRVERAKELLVYDEYSLSEIAFRLHYSSASHFTRQFKKVTGFTPSELKKRNLIRRTPIEQL